MKTPVRWFDSAALVVVLAVAVIGCGGAATPDPDVPTQKHDMHAGRMGDTEHGDGDKGQGGQGDEMDEMAALPPEVKTFHDTLAPRWHAEHGAKRMTDTCAAISEFHTGSEAIAAATPPAGVSPASWSASARQLTDAVAALDATCKASDATAFEPAFATVHKRFHGLLEAAGHDDHGKPQHGDHGEPEHPQGDPAGPKSGW
jgi:hypothetical protein